MMKEPPIELVLPPEFDRFESFQAARISDDYLKFRTGLYRDCLAIFVDGQAEVLNGDLAVVSIRSESGVLIGFVSCDMNMVTLEKPFYNLGYLEIWVFNEDEVKILGKIVGYCKPIGDEKDKYVASRLKSNPRQRTMASPADLLSVFYRIVCSIA